MFILIALVIACAAGIIAHFVLPRRDLRGAALSGALATVTAGVVYTALQWAGLGQDNVWLWVASLGGGIAMGFFGTLALTRLRERHDAERAAALGLTPKV